jgi:hypothetical protein
MCQNWHVTGKLYLLPLTAVSWYVLIDQGKNAVNYKLMMEVHFKKLLIFYTFQVT